jgi:hypothetical protein
MKYKTITANGYRIDGNEPFTGMTVALGEWDGIEDAEDEGIFYYLDGEPAIGKHGDFVITEAIANE